MSALAEVHPATTARPEAEASPGQDFESLLKSVLPRAFAAARYLTGDPADAEDLVQDAALKAFDGFQSFQAGTNFKAWFLRILTNAFYMKYRTNRRRPQTVSLDSAPDLFLYTKTAAVRVDESGDDPARAFMAKLETEQVIAAIQALPLEYRTVAALYFLDDLTYRDIASIMDCPIGTVRSRVHRGRKLLQVALWRVAQDHGIV